MDDDFERIEASPPSEVEYKLFDTFEFVDLASTDSLSIDPSENSVEKTTDVIYSEKEKRDILNRLLQNSEEMTHEEFLRYRMLFDFEGLGILFTIHKSTLRELQTHKLVLTDILKEIANGEIELNKNSQSLNEHILSP